MLRMAARWWITLGMLMAIAGQSVRAAAQTERAQRDPQTESQSDAALRQLVAANNLFGCELYGKLRARRGNLCFSPYSISVSLAMTCAGAREITASQIVQALHLVSNEPAQQALFGRLVREQVQICAKGHYQLKAATALWNQKGYDLRPDYQHLLKADYLASAREVNFQSSADTARQAINAWAGGESNNKIKNLVRPKMLGYQTRLAITNVASFNGRWKVPFKKQETLARPFTRADATQVSVPMMQQSGSFRYAEAGGLQWLELPYLGDEACLLIVLPTKASGSAGPERLAKVEEQLTPARLAEWTKKLESRRVVVSLPKFTIAAEIDLKDPLIALGIGDIFCDDADLSGACDREGLYLATILHESRLDVSEQGIATAAAADSGFAGATPANPTTRFNADHPFLYLLRDKRTGSILFLGRVMDPQGT